MLVVEVKGGLGNQMFQYALGRRLSIEWNLPLTLDLTWFNHCSERIFTLGSFRIQADVGDPKTINQMTKKNYPGKVRRLYYYIQDRLPYVLKQYHREKKAYYDERIFLLRSPVYLSGYWQSEPYILPIRKRLLEEFSPINSLSGTAHYWISEMMRGPSVSVHIRRGDYVTNPKAQQHHGVLGKEYYLQAISNMENQIGEATYYLFSDDPEWVVGSFHGSKFRLVSNGELADWEEMVLMSKCTHHIIANSSYSWWGAWLDPKDDKIVFAPKPWFVESMSYSPDLIPSSWRTLDFYPDKQ